MRPNDLESTLAFHKVVVKYSQWLLLFYFAAVGATVVVDDVNVQRKYFALAYGAGVMGLCLFGLWLLEQSQKRKPWRFIWVGNITLIVELLFTTVALSVKLPSENWLYSTMIPLLLAIIGVCTFGSLLWTPPKQGESSTGKKPHSKKPTKHSQKRPAKKRTNYNLPPALTNPPPSGGKGKR